MVAINFNRHVAVYKMTPENVCTRAAAALRSDRAIRSVLGLSGGKNLSRKTPGLEISLRALLFMAEQDGSGDIPGFPASETRYIVIVLSESSVLNDCLPMLLCGKPSRQRE